MTEHPSNNYLLVSYLSHRKAIGLLGILLGPILVVGNLIFSPCKLIQKSLSAYYFTFMSEAFVGIVVAIALFLFFYKGYDNDQYFAKAAAISAFLVAFFPPFLEKNDICRVAHYKNLPIYGTIHTIAAVIFFCILAYFCFFIFTKKPTTVQNSDLSSIKKTRNKIYVICGWIINICLIGLLLDNQWAAFHDFFEPIQPILTFEIIALVAFGYSWIIKGQMFFHD